MPVRRRRGGESITARYKRSRKAWASRVAKARDLREGCARWSDVDSLLCDFRIDPMNRKLIQWTHRTGVKLHQTDIRFLSILVSVLRKYRGLWLSSQDIAWRLGCSERTVRNIVSRLRVLDIIRIVPQYDECEAYLGRQTVRGGGSSGKRYTRRQRPNTITLGKVGRLLFVRAAISKEKRAALVEAVDNLFVAPDHLTRKRLPGNGSRSKQLLDLEIEAEALLKPKGPPDNAPWTAQVMAEQRAKALLTLVPNEDSP